MACSAYNMYVLSTHPTFLQRVEMALLKRAQYVKAMADPPAGEVAVANAILGNSGVGMPGAASHTSKMARLIATDTALENNVRNDVSGGDISEADLDTAVATHFLKLA